MPEAPLEIGKFRHRVTILSKQVGKPTPDSAGQTKPVYVAAGTFWAGLSPLRGAELYAAAQVKATTSDKIIMRNSGVVIHPGDQLRFEQTGRIFNVDSVTRDQEINALFIITATELIK